MDKIYTITIKKEFPKTPNFNCGSPSIDQYAEYGMNWDRAEGYHNDIYFVAYDENQRVIGLCTLVLYYDMAVREFIDSYIEQTDIYPRHVNVAYDKLNLSEMRIGFLEVVAVNIEWQGKGIGKALYNMCEKEGLKYIFLKT